MGTPQQMEQSGLHPSAKRPYVRAAAYAASTPIHTTLGSGALTCNEERKEIRVRQGPRTALQSAELISRWVYDWITIRHCRIPLGAGTSC